LSGLRQDRVPKKRPKEAAESAAPIGLMRLFSITEQAALPCLGAAHPERTAKLPG
jgi:hypothetical protein